MIARILPAALALAAAFSFSSASAEPALKVGLILPLSGEVSSLGLSCSNGIKLGMSKLDPNIQSRLQLIYDDDMLDAKKAVGAFNRLSAVSDIDAAVCISSGIGNVLAPLAEKRAVPLIAVGASDHRVSRDRKYALTFWVSPEEEARVIVPEIERRGYKHIAQVVSQHDGMLVLRDAVNRENHGRFAVSLSEDLLASEKDFRTVISRIKHRPETDAVMLFLMPGHLGLFALQARQQSLTLPLFGVESLEDTTEVKIAQGALTGAWYVNAADMNQQFLKEYLETFPGAPMWGAANCHDVALLIGAAVKAGADTREALNQFLHTVKNFSGALGTYSASGDNRFTLPAALKVVTENGFESLTRP